MSPGSQRRQIVGFVAMAGGISVLAVLHTSNDALAPGKVVLGTFGAIIILEGVAVVGGDAGTEFAHGLALVALLAAVLINGGKIFGLQSKLVSQQPKPGTTPIKKGPVPKHPKG